MLNEKDIEYLSRPLIEGLVYIIENEHVKISSPHTIFAENRTIIPFMKDEILSMYKSVVQKAKSKGVKISYKQHMRKTIIERWSEYEISCDNAKILFKRIIEQVKIVQERGIHRGTRDDSELDKLHKLCNEYNKFYWRSSIISHISSIYYSLKNIERDLSASNSSLYKIYI